MKTALIIIVSIVVVVAAILLGKSIGDDINKYIDEHNDTN